MSRKVTKFLTVKNKKNAAKIEQDIQKFRAEVAPLVQRLSGLKVGVFYIRFKASSGI